MCLHFAVTPIPVGGGGGCSSMSEQPRHGHLLFSIVVSIGLFYSGLLTPDARVLVCADVYSKSA